MLEEPRFGWIPIGAPLNVQTTEEHSTHFDDSVNAVSLGFVATAILISMFLVMAIFERFLRPNSSDSQNHEDLEAQLGSNPKLGYPSPKMTFYASAVSVLMPGDNMPTFIAHPAPVACPPEPILWPQHQNIPMPTPSSYSTTITNS